MPLPSVEPRTVQSTGLWRRPRRIGAPTGRVGQVRIPGRAASASRGAARAAPKFSKTLRVPLPDVEPQLHPPFPRVRPHQLLGEAYIDVVREPLAVDDALAIDRIHRGPLLV